MERVFIFAPSNPHPWGPPVGAALAPRPGKCWCRQWERSTLEPAGAPGCGVGAAAAWLGTVCCSYGGWRPSGSSSELPAKIFDAFFPPAARDGCWGEQRGCTDASGEGSSVAASSPRMSPRSTHGSLLPRAPPLLGFSRVQLRAGWALGCSPHPPGRDPLWPPQKAPACALPGAVGTAGCGAGEGRLGRGGCMTAVWEWKNCLSGECLVCRCRGWAAGAGPAPASARQHRQPMGLEAGAGHPAGVGTGLAVPTLPGGMVPPSLGDTALGLGFSSPRNLGTHKASGRAALGREANGFVPPPESQLSLRSVPPRWK